MLTILAQENGGVSQLDVAQQRFLRGKDGKWAARRATWCHVPATSLAPCYRKVPLIVRVVCTTFCRILGIRCLRLKVRDTFSHHRVLSFPLICASIVLGYTCFSLQSYRALLFFSKNPHAIRSNCFSCAVRWTGPLRPSNGIDMTCSLVVRYCLLSFQVLDVGCGSGVLAIFAAQAGAKKV